MRDAENFMKKNFRIALRYDPEGYWIAENPELPGCKADGETPEEALSSLEISRRLWIESRIETGLEVPEPQEIPQYSGRFVLRIAKSLHRELAQEAEAEGVSLNSLVGQLLAKRHAQTVTTGSFGQSAAFGYTESTLKNFRVQNFEVSKLVVAGQMTTRARQPAGKYQRVVLEQEKFPEKVPQYA